MSKTLELPKGKVEHVSLFIEKWEEIVRHQDE